MEHALYRTRDPDARRGLARYAYTYLHLPLVAGNVLFALALKRLLHDLADPRTPAWGLPLPVIGTALREQLAAEAKQDEWRGQNL